MEQELAHAVNASSKAMDVVYANSKSSGVRVTLLQIVLLVSADVLMSSLFEVKSGPSLSVCLCVQALSCSVVLQMVGNVKALLSETELLLAGKMSMVTVSSGLCL